MPVNDNLDAPWRPVISLISGISSIPTPCSWQIALHCTQIKKQRQCNLHLKLIIQENSLIETHFWLCPHFMEVSWFQGLVTLLIWIMNCLVFWAHCEISNSDEPTSLKIFTNFGYFVSNVSSFYMLFRYCSAVELYS